MVQLFSKVAGLSALVLLLQSGAFAQDTRKDTAPKNADGDDDKMGNYDEVIIKRKSDKNAKVTVEIKDGQVFVNGKPVNDYQDDDLSVRRKKIKVIDGQSFSYSGPDGSHMLIAPRPLSPFRSRGGTMSIEGDGPASNRPLLGVTSEKTSDPGARITEVSKGSAAEKAGLKTGDLITKVDELVITTPEDLSAAIRKYKPQDKITITYKRDGKEQKLTATLGKAKNISVFGFNGNAPGWDDFDLNTIPGVPGFAWGDRPRLGIKAQDTEDDKGAKVLDVSDESPADKAGIKEGDIITRFDGKPVENASALAEIARESRSKSSVKVSLLRDGKAMEIEVKTPKRLKTADL